MLERSNVIKRTPKEKLSRGKKKIGDKGEKARGLNRKMSQT